MQQSDLTVVIGLGITGLSCVEYLRSKGMQIAVMDTRAAPPKLAEMQQAFPDVPVSLGQYDTTLLTQAAQIVVSPGVSLKEPAIQQQLRSGKPILGDIELFAREVAAPVIAITGTNAKSTVTTLIAAMLNQAGYNAKACGNIGTSALSALMGEAADFYVLELSSYQLEATQSLQPAVAMILNISPDHLDRYEFLSDYVAAKQRIYRNCDTAIFNYLDKLTWPMQPCQQVAFAVPEPAADQFGLLEQAGDMFIARGQEPLLALRELRLRGRHHALNAQAALACGYALGIPLQPMLETLKTFPGLEHRCEVVTEHQGILWIDDSKATNVGSTIAALDGVGPDIDGKIILILGGDGKNADFTQLIPSVREHVKQVCAYGRDAAIISQALENVVPLSRVSDLPAAVTAAVQTAVNGDCVLLAPACASFDMYQDFAERGRHFKQLVKMVCQDED